MHFHLNVNAASIHSHIRNGCAGLLALIVTPSVFNTLSHVYFVAPANPGPNHVYPTLVTQYQTQKIRTAQENSTKFFRQFDD